MCFYIYANDRNIEVSDVHEDIKLLKNGGSVVTAFFAITNNSDKEVNELIIVYPGAFFNPIQSSLLYYYQKSKRFFSETLHAVDIIPNKLISLLRGFESLIFLPLKLWTTIRYKNITGKIGINVGKHLPIEDNGNIILNDKREAEIKKESELSLYKDGKWGNDEAALAIQVLQNRRFTIFKLSFVEPIKKSESSFFGLRFKPLSATKYYRNLLKRINSAYISPTPLEFVIHSPFEIKELFMKSLDKGSPPPYDYMRKKIKKIVIQNQILKSVTNIKDWLFLIIPKNVEVIPNIKLSDKLEEKNPPYEIKKFHLCYNIKRNSNNSIMNDFTMTIPARSRPWGIKYTGLIIIFLILFGDIMPPYIRNLLYIKVPNVSIKLGSEALNWISNVLIPNIKDFIKYFIFHKSRST